MAAGHRALLSIMLSKIELDSQSNQTCRMLRRVSLAAIMATDATCICCASQRLMGINSSTTTRPAANASCTCAEMPSECQPGALHPNVPNVLNVADLGVQEAQCHQNLKGQTPALVTAVHDIDESISVCRACNLAVTYLCMVLS